MEPSVNQKPPFIRDQLWKMGCADSQGLTKGTEDYKRESISEEEFENSPEAHQEASNEPIGANGGDAISAGASPAHELAGKRTETKQEAKKCQWRGVCECVSELAFDSVLRVEVYLLKQLRADSDRVGGTDLVDGFARGNISV